MKSKNYESFPRFVLIRCAFSLILMCFILSMLMSLLVLMGTLSTLNESMSLSRISRDFEEILRIKESKKCFWPSNGGIYDDLELLEEILEAEIKPKPGKSIFFHETSCTKNGIISLNAR